MADDSDLILVRLQEMLSIDKHVELVGMYRNGTDALEALRILKPDLAIVDIKMPGLTGLEVLNEIRKEDKKVNFIILTFYALEYFRQMAIQAGADYFFSKVDDFEKLASVVKELVLNENNYNRIHPISN